MIDFNVPNWFFVAQRAETTGRISYELARLRDADNPGLMVTAILVVALAMLSYVAYLYRRDAVELSGFVRWLLPLLRFCALSGLVVYFLGIERRSTQELIVNDQVAMLVDVSLSMGLNDNDASGVPAGPTRSQQVAATLAESPFLTQLAQQHDVHLTRFDKQSDLVVAMQKLADDDVRRFESAALESKGEQESATANWSELLLPRGTETRLGDALQSQLQENRTGPLAAVVVVSDGVSNAGIDPLELIPTAKEAGIAVHTIGIGSTQPPRSMTLTDVVAPRRAFPGDRLTITAFVQAHGYAGRLADVELWQRPANEQGSAPVRVTTERVVLGPNDEILPVPFEMEPETAGEFIYDVTLVALPGDQNTQDNRREVAVDIVDRQSRVLLVAGGPARDYRFLRNTLYRDPTMSLDVLLQSAPPGISQEADRILTEFPSSKDELYQYDCLVAIDPDWTRLDAAQVQMITDWIAEEAAGMVVTTGPVHTARWSRSTEHAGLKALYPVEFRPRLTLLDDGYNTSETPWPLAFERPGREAEFLWLESSAASSQGAWEEHSGIFGYYDVKGAKPAATVYARVSDLEMAWDDQQPVYFVGHFYGAGRVFYAGSAEFWRLRMADPAYFDKLWTKLIRHVSQGRLLRGSSHGALLVERDRFELGETVLLRARLTNQRHEPLVASAVTAQLLQPDATTKALRLEAELDQPGMFAGQFTPLQEGAYRIILDVPDSANQQLTHRFQVRIPDLERLRASRNAPLLAELARETGGQYFPDLQTAIYGGSELQPLAKIIPDRTESTLIEGAPDTDFARRQMHVLLAIVCAALFTEWTVRRFCRLA